MTMTHNIHNMDCMELMRSFPDKYFDLAIVDPPYGIGEDGAKNHSRSNATKATLYTAKNWDNKIPSNEYFAELKRVSKNQIIWGGNYFGLPASSCWIVWDKDNSGDFADCELAWTSFNTAVRKYKFRWNGMLQGDMVNKEHRIHPTQKPVKLYDWIFKNYLPTGGKVLDTHGGSMSSVISAIKAGNIEMTCSELDNDYFKAAKERILTFQSQLDMFAPPADIIFHQ
jgi:site-specific DNA-methyltransferase (adenine-specific)